MTLINIRHLRAYVALAERQHFTQAAEDICLSQPALTALIQQLEADLGVQLIRRTTRKVELTDVGFEFLNRARRILADFADTLEHVADYRKLAHGRLRIAALPSLCASVLPPMLKSFQALHPQVKITVLDAVGERILEALRSNAIDLAFSVGDDLPDMVARPLFNDRLALICPRDHSLAGGDVVRWEQLDTVPVIAMARGTTIRTLTDSAAATAGVRLNITLEPHLVPSAIAFAKSGLGMAILPSSMVTTDPGLVALTLAEPEVLRTISLLYPSQYPLLPAPAAFCDHASRAAKDLTFGH